MIQQSAAGLLLDPGLGKTSSTLSAFKILKAKGYVNRMLVVTPIKPMYDVWPTEIEKWANFNQLVCAIAHGKDKEWEIENLDGIDVLLVNPEAVGWLFGFEKKGKRYAIDKRRVKNLGIDMLVIDESTKFKSRSSNRFKAMKLALPLIPRRYILTGTISPNGLEDLWSQIYLLDGGNALGRYITHFREEYFDPPTVYEPFKWTPHEDAVERIAEKISPLVLQLTAEDHLDMPDLMTVELGFKLPDKIQKTYDQVESDFITLVGENLVVAGNAAAAGTKCRQMANGAVYLSTETGGRSDEYKILHDLKLDILEELLDELSGAPLLVLYEFRHDLERLLKRFPKTPYLGAGVSQKAASAAIRRFNAGKIPMLLGHPASMGHGLNLQGACSHVCWFGIPWNFEYYDQAYRRVYRQGQQSNTVFMYHIVAKNTLDQKVMRVLGRKERDQNDLFDALKPTV